MKNAERLCLLIVLGIGACTSGTETLPESTTTLIDAAGGVAKSADGLMELRFTAGSLSEQRSITIETRRDVTADHLLSLVYRVSPTPLDASLEVWFRTDANAQIGALDSGSFEAINGATRDDSGVHVSISSLAYSMLAAFEEEEQPPGAVPDGWDDFPGTGRMFVLNTFAIANDGAALAGLGELMNDQIQQGVLGGELLVLVEIAGVNPDFLGDDPSVTVKFYGARDADDPFFPANNFSVPSGQTTCCEFLIDPQSLTTDTLPRARSRAPARIEGGRVQTLQPVPMELTLAIGPPPHSSFRLERVLFTARVQPDLLELSSGTLEGAMPMSTLAQHDNAFCKQVNECSIRFSDSTLLDLVTTEIRVEPDVDLSVPRDGLACLIDVDGDARVDRCCRANGAGACILSNRDCQNGDPVEPVVPSDPGSCALDPVMADGYSIHFSVTGVPASVVGFAQ